MRADFDQLAEKINQLIELVQQLRLEKTELTLQLTRAHQHNVELTERLKLVQQRIDNLLSLISMDTPEENLT